MADLLINAGADVNAKNNDGCTPLYDTVVCWEETKRRVDFARFLIAKGAEVRVRNKFGETPLHFAATGSGEVRSDD